MTDYATEEELRKRFPNISESVLRRSIAAVAPLVATEREQGAQPALEQNAPTKQSRRRSVGACVTLISFRRRVCDDDNDAAGYKHLRDCIARRLGLDDGDKRLTWQYGRIYTHGQEGTAVIIQMR